MPADAALPAVDNVHIASERQSMQTPIASSAKGEVACGVATSCSKTSLPAACRPLVQRFASGEVKGTEKLKNGLKYMVVAGVSKYPNKLEYRAVATRQLQFQYGQPSLMHSLKLLWSRMGGTTKGRIGFKISEITDEEQKARQASCDSLPKVYVVETVAGRSLSLKERMGSARF